MSVFNKYLNHLVPANVKENMRWGYHQNEISCFSKTKVPFSANVKIETVLSCLHKGFERFDHAFVDKESYEQLGILVHLVKEKVQNYKSKHGICYLLFCKIFYGDVNKISANLILRLEKIRKRYIHLPDHSFSGLHLRSVDPLGMEQELLEMAPDIANPQFGPPLPTAAQLEKLLKQDRLKFYHLFSEQIQIQENEPIRLPLIEITKKEVFIRCPQQQVANGFERWLEKWFNERRIKFEKPVVKPGSIYNETRFAKEFVLSLEDAFKIIKDIPDQGLNLLSQMLRQKDCKVHHKSSLLFNDPCVEETISFTLAHLDPHLHQLLNENPLAPFELQPLPIVEFNDLGMSIKLPDSEENLKNLILQIFDFKGGLIEKEEVHFERAYTYQFFISRDEIGQAFKVLGLNEIPIEDGNVKMTYLQYLQENQKYHSYQPVLKEDALESIVESLKALVPNKAQSVPYVTYHPRRWLSVKLPQEKENYTKDLLTYLKCTALTISEVISGSFYDQEIIIYDDENKHIEKFLKKLQLENSPEGNPYIELLRKCPGLSLSRPYYAEVIENRPNIRQTIARTLSALDPEIKEILEKIPPEGSTSHLSLVSIDFNEKGIQIKIPKQLNDKKYPLGPHKLLSFGEYISFVFGLEGSLQMSEEIECYIIDVPLKRAKCFLEKDLSLTTLPSKYQIKDPKEFKKDKPLKKFLAENFYHYFSFKIDPHLIPYGRITNFKLKNPPIKIPDIPEISDKDILNQLKKLFKEVDFLEKNQETYISDIEATILSLRNPNYADYERTNENIRLYLKLIVHALMTNKQQTKESKQEVLANVGIACSRNTCQPGKMIKLQEEYRALSNPQFKDKVKAHLLDKVEKAKIQLLKYLFKHLEHNVHFISAIKVKWGKELGLDEREGKDDEYWKEYGYDPHKDFFDKKIFINHREEKIPNEKSISGIKEYFNKHLVHTTFALITGDKEIEGSVVNYQNYQEQIHQILKDQGFTPDEIHEKMNNLFFTLKDFRLKLEQQNKPQKEIECELSALRPNTAKLRQHLTLNALRFCLIKKNKELAEIEQKIEQLLPNETKIKAELTKNLLTEIVKKSRPKAFILYEDRIDEALKNQQQLKEILESLDWDFTIFENELDARMKANQKAREMDLENEGVSLESIEEKIKECNDRAVTLSEEAIKILMIKIGVLSSGTL